jgi:hypothetical protein
METFTTLMEFSAVWPVVAAGCLAPTA